MTNLEWNARVRQVACQSVQVIRESFGRGFDSLEDTKIAMQIEVLLHSVTPTMSAIEPEQIGSQPDSETSEVVDAVAVALAKPVEPEPPAAISPSPETEQKEAA